jgi:hypothetical protein
MASTIGEDLGPSDYLVATRALTAAQQLLMLDKSWTREAARASQAETRDDQRIADVRLVVDAMDHLFAECRDLAPALVEVAGRDEAAFQAKYEALLADLEGRGERTTEIARRLRHHVDGSGGAMAHLRYAAGRLEELAGPEMEQIRAEYDRVRQGEASQGDMSDETEAVVTAIAIAATVEFGPLGGALVEGVAHAIDCLT